MHSVFAVFGFVKAARDYAHVEPEAAISSPKFLSYHRRVLWIGAITGVTLAVVGTVGAITESKQMDHVDWYILFVGPILLGMGGCLGGIATACLFASSEFLTSPIGARWMESIGVKTITSARIVCGLLSTLTLAAILFFASANSLQKRGFLPPVKHRQPSPLFDQGQ